MRLQFHPDIASDVSRIMDYYEGVAGATLADDFYRELQFFFHRAAESPEAYARGEANLRRVNLARFPYHFLFRIVGDNVRILVVRHHRRQPRLGIHRR